MLKLRNEPPGARVPIYRCESDDEWVPEQLYESMRFESIVTWERIENEVSTVSQECGEKDEQRRSER